MNSLQIKDLNNFLISKAEMKSQFYVQPCISQFQKQRKLQPQVYQRKSRQSSRQGHSNPLKVKNSFLRQSLTFQNNNQPNLYNKDQHNVNNSIKREFNGMKICQSSQLSHNALILQSDKKHDFMIKKIVEKYSNNVSPTKGYKMQVHQKDFLEYQNLNNASNNKQKQVIRLSGKKASENVVTMSVNVNNNGQNNNNKSSSSKENSLLISSNNNKGPLIIDTHSFSQILKQNQKSMLINQKSSRLSNGSSIAQSILCDSSLANFINQSHTPSQIQPSNPLPASQFQDQFNLILKRLVKNQCEIQTLKRNKQCFDSQIQTLWVQVAKNQQKLKAVEKKQYKIEEKLLEIQKNIGLFKDEMKVINIKNKQGDFQGQLKNIKETIEKSVKQRESFCQKIKQECIKAVNDSTLESLQKIKKQFQMNFQNKLKSSFLDTSSISKLKQSQRHGSNGYKISQTKKCHDHIKIVYQQLIKVTKSNSSTNSAVDDITYISSDRSKLLANALNLNLNNIQYRNNPQKKRTNFSTSLSTSMPVSPQNSKSQKSQKQTNFNFTTKQLNFENTNKTSPLQITTTQKDILTNQVKYFIDKQGFLLDQNLYYILDSNDQQIKIDSSMLEVLKSNNVLTERV